LCYPAPCSACPRAPAVLHGHADEPLKNPEMRGGSGRLKGVVAAIYGSPSGHLAALMGGGLCGTCMPNPAIWRKESGLSAPTCKP
jgi:hypothetical protein